MIDRTTTVPAQTYTIGSPPQLAPPLYIDLFAYQNQTSNDTWMSLLVPQTRVEYSAYLINS